MPIKKISNLTPLETASVDDLLVIVDVGDTSSPTGKTKKITTSNFFNFVKESFSSGSLLSDRWEAVSTDQYIDLSKTNPTTHISIEVGSKIHATGSIWSKIGSLEVGEVNSLGGVVPEFYLGSNGARLRIQRYGTPSSSLANVEAGTFYGTASHFDRLTVEGIEGLDVGGLSPHTPEDYSTQIHNSIASGVSSTAIGYKATASGDYSIAIGNQSGKNSQQIGGKSVELGYFTRADDQSISLGWSATGIGSGNVTIGSGTNISGSSGVSIGRGASISRNSAGAVAVGYFAGISSGNSNYESSNSSISIGYDSDVIGSAESVSIGALSLVSGSREMVVLGSRSKAYEVGSIAIGYSAQSNGYGSISIGRGSKSTSQAGYSGSIAIGSDAVVTSERGISIGQEASGSSGISIGYKSFSGDDSFAIGQRVRNQMDNIGEIGIWSSTNNRSSGVRIDGSTGCVSISMTNSNTPLDDDGGVSHGYEGPATLMQEAYSIRRDGDDLYIDINVGGVVKTLSLGTAT